MPIKLNPAGQQVKKMTTEEFKNEMIEQIFNEVSYTSRGYVAIIPSSHECESEGIDFVRLDDSTIAYRINTETWDSDWEIEGQMNDEKHFNDFINKIEELLIINKQACQKPIKLNPAGQQVNNMIDNSKFWIADIFYRNPMFFSSREEFEEEFNNLREIGVQFTWNDPEM